MLGFPWGAGWLGWHHSGHCWGGSLPTGTNPPSSLLSAPPRPDFCFLIFSINPRGLGGSCPPPPSSPPCLGERWVLRARRAPWHPPHPRSRIRLSCFLFLTHPPTPRAHPLPVCLSVHPPQERRDLHLTGTWRAPPARATTLGTPGWGHHMGGALGQGVAPGWGVGGHQEGARSRRYTPPIALWILAGICPSPCWHLAGGCGVWHRVPPTLFPPAMPPPSLSTAPMPNGGFYLKNT